MFKNILPLVAAMALATPAHAYSSLDDLMADMNRKQAEAIHVYLEQNPEADDAAEARERLIYNLISLDDYAGALVLLDAMYEALPEDKAGLDLSSAFGEIVVPKIQLYRMAGRRDDAMAFVERVRTEFKGHAMEDTIQEALDEFSRMFDQPGVGDALEISFTALDGREVDLAAMTGRVVLVDFWATWCAPCIRAMPGLKQLYREYRDEGFEIIGISLDEDREKLQAYIDKESITWPQHFDGKGWENAFAETYGIQSIPTTFLIGPDGLIAAVDASEAALAETIRSLLAPDGKEAIKQVD